MERRLSTRLYMMLTLAGAAGFVTFALLLLTQNAGATFLEMWLTRLAGCL